MPSDKKKSAKLFRQGMRGVSWLYLAGLTATLCISTGAHFGMKDVQVPASLYTYGTMRPEKMEVTWDFTHTKKPDDNKKEKEKEVPPEPLKPKYVETNPDAPENEPDKTNNESDRNQQAAQEKLDPELETKDAPKTEGEEQESNKIISGTFQTSQPTPAPEPGVYKLQPAQQAPAEKKETTDGLDPKKAQAPLPPPPSPVLIEEGDGKGVATVEQNTFKDIEPKPTQTKVIPLTLPETPAIDAKALREMIAKRSIPQPQPIEPKPLTPKPRPRLPASVLPGPIKENRTNAPRIGRMGTDAKWSDFGEYSQRMFAAIGLQWNKLVYNANLNSIPVSQVHVRFILNKYGQIESIEIPENTAGQLPAFLCTDAIESRAPFGLWTEEMIAKFGDSTDVNIHFNYR
jgi:hypothetical protein